MDSFGVVLLAQINLSELVPGLLVFHIDLDELVQNCNSFIVPVHVSIHGDQALHTLLILWVLLYQVK